MIIHNKDRLYLAESPWLFRLVGPESDVTDFSWSLDNSKVVVRALRGRKMASALGTFDEIAAALQFPYYFGENWGAFEECINDLSWLPGGGYVLFVMDFATVLAIESPDQLLVFLNILERTGQAWSKPIALGEAWDRPSKPFHVVLHASNADSDARLASIGLSIPSL
jgi:hypothetical protein